MADTASATMAKKVKEMIGRRLIFGDLHGSYKALMQCLERADFRPEKDVMYSVGDIADGYPDVYECLSFLKELPSFHPVIGNHDVWLQNWLSSGLSPDIWTSQGGSKSIASFERNGISGTEKMELARWMSTWPYVRMFDDVVIMHGGPGLSLSDMDMEKLSEESREFVEPAPDGYHIPTRKADIVLWDREYFRCCQYDEKTGRKHRIGLWSEQKWLFTGHTEYRSTELFISEKHRFVNLDTMAGSYGCLTIMDMDTFDYWQSDLSSQLYPGYGPEYW